MEYQENTRIGIYGWEMGDRERKFICLVWLTIGDVQ